MIKSNTFHVVVWHHRHGIDVWPYFDEVTPETTSKIAKEAATDWNEDPQDPSDQDFLEENFEIFGPFDFPVPHEKKRFILWKADAGSPKNAYGEILTSGSIGMISPESVFLTLHGVTQNGLSLSDSIKRLRVGECVENVEYNISGIVGIYDVYRVR